MPFAIARFGQQIGVGRRFALRLARAELLADGAAPGERVGNFAERRLDRALVVRDGRVPLRLGEANIGAAGAGLEDRCRSRRAPALHWKAPPLNRPASDVLARPSRPVSDDPREQSRAGGADLRHWRRAADTRPRRRPGGAAGRSESSPAGSAATVGAASSIDARQQSRIDLGAPTSSCSRFTSWASAVRWSADVGLGRLRGSAPPGEGRCAARCRLRSRARVRRTLFSALAAVSSAMRSRLASAA